MKRKKPTTVALVWMGLFLAGVGVTVTGKLFDNNHVAIVGCWFMCFNGVMAAVKGVEALQPAEEGP